MAMVNGMLSLSNNVNVKDSRWLTLEVCREYQRNKCTRTENECKFAHPPAHVEVQNGRVTACFDSIKGKCQRKDPPCKYLHPPQHLREQLLQNGRNNLILRNLQMQAAHAAALQPMMPMQAVTASNKPAALTAAYPTIIPGQYPVVAAHPYIGSVPSSVAFNPYGIQPGVQTLAIPNNDATMVTSLGSVIPSIPSNNQKLAMTRADRLEQNALPGVIPYKRIAVADGKSGLPVYQPTTTPYQQAIAAMQLNPQYLNYGKGAFGIPVSQSSPLQQTNFPGVQIPQQQLVPVTIAGHPPSLPRF